MKSLLAAGVLALCTGCPTETRCAPAALPPLANAPAYAIVTSDYSSTALALLDAEGELLTEAWIDSGSTASGISATLTGDVVLPTDPSAAAGAGRLALIDRLTSNVVTRVDFGSGTIPAQVRTQAPFESGGGGYRSNPQDLVWVDGERIVVSRFEPNLTGDASELDRGNDLAFVSFASHSVESRIDLGPLDVEIDGEHFFARPARMTRVEDGNVRVIVGLARLSQSFRSAGPGGVALVDLSSGSARAIDLEGLTNCGEVRRAPDGTDRVWIACAGQPFGDQGTRSSEAGLAVLRVYASEAHVEYVWRASDHADLPPTTGTVIPLDETRALAVAMGDADHGDSLVLVDVALGEGRVVANARESYTLGRGVFDEASGRAFVPDANDGLRRFDVHIGIEDGLASVEIEETAPVAVSRCRDLPAREIAAVVN